MISAKGARVKYSLPSLALEPIKEEEKRLAKDYMEKGHGDRLKKDESQLERGGENSPELSSDGELLFADYNPMSGEKGG